MCPHQLISAWILIVVISAVGCNNRPAQSLDAYFVRGGLTIEHFGERAWQLSRNGVKVRKWYPGTQMKGVIRLSGDRIYTEVPWKPGDRFTLSVDGQSLRLTAPQRPSPLLVASIDLENLKPHGGRMGHNPDTQVRFSPSGDRLAIGTIKGRLVLVEIPSGRKRWSRKLAEGMVKRIAWGTLNNHRVLYVGEQSPEGLLYCLDAANGEEIWRFDPSPFLGRRSVSSDKKNRVYNLPGIYYLRVTPGGDLLLLGVHGRYIGQDYVNDCLVWRLEGDSGRVLWRWPQKVTFPYGITWVGASADGRTLAFISHNTFGPIVDGPYMHGTLYCLDGMSGSERWHYRVPPLEPYYSRVGSWQGISVSSEGDLVILGLNDGRAMLFDAEKGGQGPLWTLAVGTPVMVGDLPVASPISYTRLSRNTVYLAMPSTTIPAGARAGRHTPQPHPHARHFFAYDHHGKLQWQYRTEGAAQGIAISADDRWVGTCVGASHVRDDREHFGMTLFDTLAAADGDPLVYHYATEGPVFFQADITPDGRYLALSESPYTLDEGKTIYGSYRVHVIH